MKKTLLFIILAISSLNLIKVNAKEDKKIAQVNKKALESKPESPKVSPSFINSIKPNKNLINTAKALTGSTVVGLTGYSLWQALPNLLNDINEEGLNIRHFVPLVIASCVIYTGIKAANFAYDNFKELYKNVTTKAKRSKPEDVGILAWSPWATKHFGNPFGKDGRIDPEKETAIWNKILAKYHNLTRH